MREIQLTQNQVALVDDDMYEELNQHKWHTHKSSKIFYAERNSPQVDGKHYTIKMHHEIIGRPLKDFMTDHADGNGLNNQRENLRHVTRRQNNQNRQNCEDSSRYPGVHWHKAGNKWRAWIRINGKQKYLGSFTDERKAFSVYKSAVEALGETIIDENIYVNL